MKWLLAGAGAAFWCSAADAQLTQDERNAIFGGEVAAAQAPKPRWAKFREVAEAAVKQRLVDPSSAQFEWPYGFLYGTWKPFFQKRYEGYWTCGRVNARNRMGGYSGSSAFVVVMDDNANVQFVDVGSGKEIDVVGTQCTKSAKNLPPAPEDMFEPQSMPVTSVADELGKLADLRDRGVLSNEEFEAEKAKLLGREPQ